jgi:hypothetical protein
MSNDPEPNQDLPDADVDVDVDVGDAPNQDLPDEQPPKGSDHNRGKSDEARRDAPGQQKKEEGQ